MRIIVLFDLPTNTKNERKIASAFRKFLEKDGFQMLQYSIYVRLCNGLDCVKKHIDRVEKATPKKGSVRSLVVTEKQYASMYVHVGSKKWFEEHKSEEQLTIF